VQTYEVTIKARSGFATPLKGDTLFGHICWQAAYDGELFNASIGDLLAGYGESPFIVVSSAFPKIYEGKREFYALKRPDLPLDIIFDLKDMDKAEIIRQRKALKKKKWMIIEKTKDFKEIKELEFIDDKELFRKVADEATEETLINIALKPTSFVAEFAQLHNTINRFTGTTGEGMFAPYSTTQDVFLPETELAVFVGIHDSIKIENLEEAFKRIGEFGFGKDASTGLGRFDVCDVSEINFLDLSSSSANACYTLSPCVPEKNKYSDMFFSPFVRFGRHGDRLAKALNPFKNPVIMADEGGVLFPNTPEVLKKPYIGTAVIGVSKTLPDAVSQGYSLFIPVKVEGLS
jgi:CRISPR-associated protein Csm4